MANVYIVNKSSHDFSDALRYGNPVYLSQGRMDRFATNNIHRQFSELMDGSSPCDYIVLCSLNVMNSIACAIFAHKHNCLNLLLYKNGSYIERNLVF